MPPDPVVGGRAFQALGVFAAPIGYLVGGIASASSLLYGLFDQWWHGLYGFDVTIASPPHQGWLHSVAMTMVGTAIVFAAARQYWWGRLGALTSLVMYGMYADIASSSLDEMLPGFGVQWEIVTQVLLPILCILVASQFLGWTGALIASALTVVLNTVMTGGGVLAAAWYADYLNLSVREGVELEFSIQQIWVPLGAGAVGALLALVRHWRPLTGWMLGLYAAVAALLVVFWTTLIPAKAGGGVVHPLFSGAFDEVEMTSLLLTLVVLGMSAFVLGWATWRLGRALRAAGTAPAAPSTAMEART